MNEAPKQEKQFDEMLKEFETEIEKFRQNVNRAEGASTRLLGPLPEDNDSGGEPKGCSRNDVAYEMQSKIDNLRDLNEALGEINDRLEAAV